MKTSAKADTKPNILVKSLPLGKALKGEVIKFRAHSAVYFLSESKTLYSVNQRANTMAIIDRADMHRYLETPALHALRKLGVLTSKEVSEVITKSRESSKKSVHARRVREFLDAAKALGVEGKAKTLVEKA